MLFLCYLIDLKWLEEGRERRQEDRVLTIAAAEQKVMRIYLAAVGRREKTPGPLYR